MVVRQNSIEVLYGEVDNLTPFEHPTQKQTFRFMDIAEQIALAEWFVEQIIASPYRLVVYAETGASPLIEICQEITQQKKCHITWQPLKIARGGSYEKPLTQLLEELPYKEKTAAPESVALELNEPFLFVDEYVDSGTTLDKACSLFQAIAPDMTFQVLSYCVFAENAADYPIIYNTLLDKDTYLNSHPNGFYPFENRIDLIGHFYVNTEPVPQRIDLTDLPIKASSAPYDDFLESLREQLSKENILNMVKEQCPIEVVADALTIEHVMRYALYQMEEDTVHKELLWQLHDMYGSAWSPLPDSYHLAFWDAFGGITIEKLSLEYQKVRETLMNDIIHLCNSRRETWWQQIQHQLTEAAA